VVVCYETAMPAPPVAVDVTPLVGVRTGIGAAVAGIVDALSGVVEGTGVPGGEGGAGSAILPYALSLRARREGPGLPPGTRHPPVPARVMLAAWQRAEHPRLDRWLAPARVIHATNYLAPPSALPTVVSVWDCSFVRFPELCTPEVRALVPIVRRAVRRGAVVHTGSQAIADEIEECFGPGLASAGRLRVVPLGPPRPPQEHEAARAPWVDALLGAGPVVLALGRHEPRKDTVALVRAFGAVAPSRPDARLVLAGPPGPDRRAVEDAMRALPPEVRARTHLAGPVREEVKWQLLRGATVLAYPSVYEGFGLPVLEAMHAGTAVVATRTGSIPEIAGGAARLVEPGDVAGLAGAIGELLDDDGARAQLVAAGHRRVAAFSWASTARGLRALYHELAP
jgi:glycosyltransferase involved in cell wall biosynthesis